jgi:hypothetical protein
MNRALIPLAEVPLIRHHTPILALFWRMLRSLSANQLINLADSLHRMREGILWQL